jgi:hypothetical protein
VSGVAGLAWSVDGSAPAAIANGGTFTVPHGSVLVYATDNAGNGAASAAATLANRTPPPAPETAPTPRTTTEAVLLRKTGATSSRLLGQLAITALPDKTTVDLRPLALGKGTFQFVFKVTTGKKTRTVTKVQTTKTGYSARISVAVGGAEKTEVTLTVRKKTGKRWTSYASGAAKL